MNPLTARYRRSNLALTAEVVAAFRVIWLALDPDRLDATFPDFLALAGAVVGVYRSRAEIEAADYLGGFTDSPEVVPPAPMNPEAFVVGMRVSSLANAKAGILRGRTVQETMQASFVLTAGLAQQSVANAGRSVVMGSAVADPGCRGWRRVTSGGCDFCTLLAGRGGVYTDATARFRSHRHCGCSAEPVYI